MTITTDDFSQWRDNPITQKVFKALRRKAEEAQRTWLAQSWDGGQVDDVLLADLRATAGICNDICDLTLEELEDALGEDKDS